MKTAGFTLFAALGIGCTDGEPVNPNPPVDTVDVPTSEPVVCPDPSRTWENTGQPFVLTWCNSCHGGEVVDSARLGAPVAVTFDTLAETRSWSERIWARSLDVEATMPPATTIPEEVLAPVRDWVTCGMPGEESPPPPPEACLGGTYAGDALSSALDASFCETFSTIDGDLTIDAPSAALDCVCGVTGALTVASSFDAPDLVLPLLSDAASVDVRAVPVVTIDLPELLAVDGDLVFEDLAEVQSIELGRLATVGGDVRVRGTTTPSLGVHRLSRVDGSVQLIDDPALSWFLPWDSLLVVGGDLEMRNTGAHESQDFRRLETIGGSLTINANGDLVSLEGYDQLTTIGGDFTMSFNPLLALFDAMPVLVSIGGDLEVHDDPLLPRNEVKGFTDRVQVEGYVHVSGTEGGGQ